MKLKSFLPLCLFLLQFSGNAQKDKWFLLAEKSQNPEEKVAYYSKSIEDFGPSSVAYTERGKARLILKWTDYKGAIGDFTEAIEINPVNEEAYFFRGTAKSYILDYQGAATDFTEALNINPRNQNCYNARGNTFFELNRNEEAISDFSKAVEFAPGWSAPYYNRGNTKFKLGDYHGAVDDCSKAVLIDPSKEAYYNSRGLAYHALGKYKEAIQDFTIYIELDSSWATVYDNRGDSKRELADYTGAVADYSSAITIDPYDTYAFYNRGRLKLRNQDLMGAVSDFSESISIDPEFINGYVLLSIVYAKSNDYEAAIKISLSGLQKDNLSSKLLDCLGYYFMEKGDINKAISYFRECNIIDPGNFDALLGLAVACYIINDKENFRKYIDQAKLSEPLLNKGMDGIREIENYGFYYSDKIKVTLIKLFLDL